MSNPDLVKAAQSLFKQYRKLSHVITSDREHTLWLLRVTMINGQQAGLAPGGFVLPTVVMVILVVVLLTTAILFRAFNRSENASNVRVNQVSLNAATPALDRARAKIDALLSDPTLPRSTPSDSALYDAIKLDNYRLGDETRLKLAYDIDGNGQITNNGTIENDETLRTAWKFPVDTDNNGRYDSFTIYAIYFRSPSRDANGNFIRKRNPLEARTPPMDTSANSVCSSATGFSTLVGNSSWYKTANGNLGKSFYVYVVNVPITNLGNLDPNKYEPYKGNKGFTALEFQQDRTLIPLANNAVWFENDLEITPGTGLTLNGRIHTNGNLLAGGHNSSSVTFHQVSSQNSCFYSQDTGLVTVGGNVGTGNISDTTDQSAVTVDLYRGFGQAPDTTGAIDSTKKSTNQTGGATIGSNDAAYNTRIAVMKQAAIDTCSSCKSATTGAALKAAVANSSYPSVITTNVKALVNDTDDSSTANDVLAQQIETYLRDRTRWVPYAEVSAVDGTGASTGFVSTSFDTNFDPPQSWREPVDSSNNFTNAATVTLTTSQLEATYPVQQRSEGVQTDVGDRTIVGNNLPAQWKQGNSYVGSDVNQLIPNANWNRPSSPSYQRWRNTQVQSLGDLGASDRNGFWEKSAAQNPSSALDSVGGVRIITGAGIYVDDDGITSKGTPSFLRNTYSFLPATSLDTTSGATDPPQYNSLPNIYVSPDTMPMSQSSSPTDILKGDLLMRATAVYHYKKSSGNYQLPIACVSSYYDPSYNYTQGGTTYNSTKNKSGLPWNADPNGRSNNGIVYDFPGRSTFSTYSSKLARQAQLVFPNGRVVNQPLRDALNHMGGATSVPNTLQLADYSAIDSALCALSILSSATPSTSLTDKPPHGAIKESSFLDAREVRQLGSTATDNTYNLSLEQRQPSEIRVTDIDLKTLASTTIDSSSEYLLPYSGIIYASRDDALRDASDKSNQSQLLSPTDFILDPTRHPNGIRLINGDTLARDPSNNTNAYNAKEKGLILATDLPLYVKGTFNLHRTSTTSTTEIEEFTQLASTSFYGRTNPNADFACRVGRTGCANTTTGDYWRPATLISDAVTLLSSAFNDGFRSDGDYDLNNNTGTAASNTSDSTVTQRLNNGFWNNSFVTNANWVNASGIPAQPTSYLTNGVTPIQRRVQFPVYLMEVCPKLPVETCTQSDWWVTPPGDPSSSTGINATSVIGQPVTTYKAGTTAVAADIRYQRFARRVAFKRNADGTLVTNTNGGVNTYVPLGIDSSGNIQAYPFPNVPPSSSTTLALWFRTTNSSSNPSSLADATYDSSKPLYYSPPNTSTGQPLLVPVLQIHDAKNPPGTIRSYNQSQTEFRDNWLSAASGNTTFNAAFVAGLGPSRADEDSPGLQNFVRFLENWNGATVKISGSFIQLKRSAFATAPIAQIFKNKTIVSSAVPDQNNNFSLFNYPYYTSVASNSNGAAPFYWAPTRAWGFDVGLLSEQPDLFAQRFTTPSTGRPNEFFREVGRDDPWVSTLLCAYEASNKTGGSGATYTTLAVSNSKEYQPTNCPPSIPSD